MEAPDKAKVVERLRGQIQGELSARMESAGCLSREEQEDMVADAVAEHMRYMHELDEETAAALREAILDDFLGFGLIQPYIDDPTITEIMVNGHAEVYVERGGKLFKVAGEGCETEALFPDDDAVRRLIARILLPLGRRCDEQHPYVDARLPDGSRVNAILPPVSLNGPCITIRKFSAKRVTAANYVEWGAASVDMMRFLNSAVASRCNLIVSGGTGSGKTTLLNALSAAIPADERIITIEDSAELRLGQPHVLKREARPANSEGRGAVTIHDLLVNALRERPDRIIVGECRSTEALEMLQAMNTGHDGSMTTVHANDPHGAFQRIETMVMESSELPSRAIRQQAVTAIDLVVQVSRYSDGSRKISEICAVTGMEGDQIVLQPLFEFAGARVEGGRVTGEHVACGFQPPKDVISKFSAAGIAFDPAWFMRAGGAR